jgi:hypothetical protein
VILLLENEFQELSSSILSCSQGFWSIWKKMHCRYLMQFHLSIRELNLLPASVTFILCNFSNSLSVSLHFKCFYTLNNNLHCFLTNWISVAMRSRQPVYRKLYFRSWQRWLRKIWSSRL